jgi:aminopeptidase N
MKKGFILVCIFMLALAGCQPASPPVAGQEGIGDPYYPDLGNGGYDVEKYTLVLDIDPSVNQVTAKATIEAKATESLSSFNLDFMGLTIDSLTVNGKTATYIRSESELTITPSEQLKVNKSFTAVVSYHGSPASVTPVTSAQFIPGVGWSHAKTGSINVLNEPNGASGWYPVNDHPRDKALYRFEITVPKPWVVAATGTLVQTIEEGDRTKFTWVMDQPMASYLASINIDQYTLKTIAGPHGIVIRSYFPPGFPEPSMRNFDQLSEMIAFLETIYGPYPFKEYGVAIANGEIPLCENGGEAIETQTLSIHCPSAMMTSEEVIIHELSHQWFGDSVSIENWKDLWLKEGMATYAQWLWVARNKDLETLTRVVKVQMIGYYPHTQTGNPPPDDLYRAEVYTGGGLVFHALRLKVGEEAFFQILHTYLERYKNGNAGTDEFIAVAEEISGQDLKSFFDAWLYSTRPPELEK